MNDNDSFLQRFSVIIFSTLTILLSFAAYLLPLPREAVPFVIILIPAILAILMAAITGGGAEARSLLGKLTRWRVSIKWLLIAITVSLILRLAISLIALLLRLIPSIQLRPITPAEAILLLVIFLIGAIPEELGWRGYVLPKLLLSYSPIVASLVIGVLWGLIHLVLHLPGMPNEGLPVILTVLQLIGLSVLLTWIFIRGGNNILLTSLFHIAQSFFVILNHGVTLAQQAWLMVVVFMAAALIVVVTDRSMQSSAGISKSQYTVSLKEI